MPTLTSIFAFNNLLLYCYVTRQSRSMERFTERMKSLEKTKAMREKRTPTPTGLTGKFSAAFSRFEPSDDKSRTRKSATVAPLASSSRVTVDTKAKSPPTISIVDRVETERPILQDDVIEATKVKQVESVPAVQVQRASSLTRTDDVEDISSKDTKSKKLERSKTFDTGIPNRQTPSGSKVLERMAKFGQPTGSASSNQQTVTTKNRDTERFERHTHSSVASKPQIHSSSGAQPHFDVDIHISREPLDGANDSDATYTYQGTRTAAITVGRDQVKVEQLDKQPRLATGREEKRQEYLNVWDTEVPVKDGSKKVFTAHTQLVVTNECFANLATEWAQVIKTPN